MSDFPCLPPCPTDCSSALQPVSFSPCAPENHWGEVSKVYVGPADLPSFDVSDLAAWTYYLTTAPDEDKIRTLIGIGDMPAPEITEVATSGDRKAYGPRQYTLNFTIDETNDINYQWMQMTACNTSYQFWFETRDGLLYSDDMDSGIYGSIVFHQIIPRLKTELVTFVGTFKWEDTFAPHREVSPLA